MLTKGADAIEHCLICGEDASCFYADSPRCSMHCTTPSIDAAPEIQEPRPYERSATPQKLLPK